MIEHGLIAALIALIIITAPKSVCANLTMSFTKVGSGLALA